MNNYKFTNTNPKGKITGDCVVRALSLALDQSWIETAQDLFEEMKKTGFMLDDPRVYEKILKKAGWIRKKQPKKSNNTKYTVRELAEILKLNKVNAIIKIPKHLTYFDGNTLLDIWDCSAKYVGVYYIKEEK